MKGGDYLLQGEGIRGIRCLSKKKRETLFQKKNKSQSKKFQSIRGGVITPLYKEFVHIKTFKLAVTSFSVNRINVYIYRNKPERISFKKVGHKSFREAAFFSF